MDVPSTPNVWFGNAVTSAIIKQGGSTKRIPGTHMSARRGSSIERKLQFVSDRSVAFERDCLGSMGHGPPDRVTAADGASVGTVGWGSASDDSLEDIIISNGKSEVL